MGALNSCPHLLCATLYMAVLRFVAWQDKNLVLQHIFGRKKLIFTAGQDFCTTTQY